MIAAEAGGATAAESDGAASALVRRASHRRRSGAAGGGHGAWTRARPARRDRAAVTRLAGGAEWRRLARTCIAVLRRARLCSSLLLAASAGAGAQGRAPNRAPTLTQLSHTAWTARDGAPASVSSIAQTADGFLWLGTSTGLFRFDGVRFERYEPPAGQTMLSGNVSALRVLPGDSLWIGYRFGGATVLAAGRLVHHKSAADGLPASTVRQFARDSGGGVWAATQGGLFERVGGGWREVGPESGLSGTMTYALLFDRRGTMWVAEETGVFTRARGARQFVRRAPHGPGTVSSPALQEGPDGSVWGAATGRGLVQLADSTGASPPGGERASGDSSQSLLFDPDGNAWLPGSGGLTWFPRPTAPGGFAAAAAGAGRQTLSPAEGLSGGLGWTVFRDREGSTWVGTTGGLDRFRPTKLTPVSLPTSLNFPAIAAGDTGALWVKSQAMPLREVGDSVVVHGPMPGGASCAYRDLDGGVWLGGQEGTLWQVRAGTLIPVAVPAAATTNNVQAIARDLDDGLWVSVQDSGVFRRRGGVWDHFVPSPTIKSAAVTIIADRAGRTWLGYTNDRLARVAGDSVRVYTAEHGLRVGHLSGLHVRGDRVWVGGEGGVMHLDATDAAARFRPLVTTAGPVRSVSGIVETADGELWLNGGEGVTRVPAAELRRALRDTAYAVRAERLDYRDGIEGTPPQIRPLPTAVEGTDGRLWFTTTQGLSWVDPKRIRRNPLAPSVRVRFVEAGGHRDPEPAGRVTLPARTTALSIAYTATSLAVPERVRFRYRLVGLDTAWQQADARREAFYTNLDPGRYRFEVLAANDDGVWSHAPAALDVVIPPTFVQTRAFLLLCAAAAGGALWLLAAWRQRRAADAMRARFAITLAERTRVARELHDTLLSGVAGIAMRLDAVATRAKSPRGVDVAALGELQEQARHTLVEARRAVVGMRASGDTLVPVSAQLAEAARRIFAGTGVDARVTSTGAPCQYPAEVEEQVVRIATEAMTNAREHADCRAVGVSCAYRRRGLRVSVRDDGRGFDPARAAANGHFGLVGMRERAAAVGARLGVDIAPGQGTTVELVAPRPAPD